MVAKNVDMVFSFRPLAAGDRRSKVAGGGYNVPNREKNSVGSNFNGETEYEKKHQPGLYQSIFLGFKAIELGRAEQAKQRERRSPFYAVGY